MKTGDKIQLGLLILAVFTLLGSGALALDNRYAKTADLVQIQSEVHQIFGKLLGGKP